MQLQLESLLQMEINFLEPCLGIKARTLLLDTRQISVAQDGGIRIILSQRIQQLLQRNLLRLGARIRRMTILVQTTLVANANAMLVVVTGMRTHLVLMAARIQSAVLGDVIVVTNLCEATSLVARLQILNAEVLVHTGSAAVHYNQIDSSLTFHFLLLFLMVQLSVLILKPFTQGLSHAISHPYMPLQLCTQKALIMAVNTVMVKLITFLIVSLFICFRF